MTTLEMYRRREKEKRAQDILLKQALLSKTTRNKSLPEQGRNEGDIGYLSKKSILQHIQKSLNTENKSNIMNHSKSVLNVLPKKEKMVKVKMITPLIKKVNNKV